MGLACKRFFRFSHLLFILRILRCSFFTFEIVSSITIKVNFICHSIKTPEDFANPINIIKFVETYYKHRRQAWQRARRSGKAYQYKPEGLDLKTWQILLRRQAAIDEKLSISSDEDNNPGTYYVVNPKTQQEYKVVYHGAKSPWNSYATKLLQV